METGYGCFPLKKYLSVIELTYHRKMNPCILNQQCRQDRCVWILPLKLDENHTNKKLPFVPGIAECCSEGCPAFIGMSNTRQD